MKILVTLFILLIFVFPSNAEDFEYGLHIKSFPEENSAFSSLVLDNGEEIKLGKELTLSFDLSVRKDNVFGDIFRIITNGNENIDLIFTVGENNKRYPLLVVNELLHPLSTEVVCDEWLPVSITLDKEEGRIDLLYGTEKLSVNHSFTQAASTRISFGLCPFENFSFQDIASVNLKEIKLFRNNEQFRYWKLDKHAPSACYDSLAQAVALASNPKWILDEHVTWDKIYFGKVPQNSQFAFNPEESKFYIVPNSKEVRIIDSEQKTEQVIEVKEGVVASNAPNQLFYDQKKKQLLSYNMDENLFSAFSFENKQWSSNTAPVQEHSFWNNSASVTEEGTIISFGGYGFYKYTNELIKIKTDNQATEKVQLSQIHPRFSSSSVIDGNTFYLFGGRGCKSGRQELFPRNYYDLYAVNLLTMQINKIWEAPSPEIDFLPGENMIFDKEKQCFYLFTTQEGGILLKIDPQKEGFKQMSMPIHEDLDAHFLYTNLYYSPKSNKLFALFNRTKADKTTDVTIYSLAFPPTHITDLYQTEPLAGKQPASVIWYLLGGVLLIILLIVVYRMFKKSRQKAKQARVTPVLQPEQNTDTPLKEAVTENTTETGTISYYDFSQRSVCLLGGFCVRDKNGENITELFTPILKQLLLLLILFTEKTENGISGHKLIQFLWSDKTEESAKNNRNVYLSKLRVALEKVGDIDIISKNGFWSIKFGNNVHCDYVEAIRYLSDSKKQQPQNLDTLNKLLELLLRGTLLPNTEAEWVDSFKSDFSSQTIDMLSGLINDKECNFNADFQLRIADTIFLHDYINEEALYIKCSILCNSGKRGLAKNIYDNFCKEYRNLLDVDYKLSLSDVINRSSQI